MFLMPGLIVAFHVTGTPFGEARRAGMEAYLRNHQQVEYILLAVCYLGIRILFPIFFFRSSVSIACIISWLFVGRLTDFCIGID